MMNAIIKMVTAFLLLSFFIVLRSHARMLPATGENGTFEFISINNKKEKEWMNMVAEQIISSSSFISNYRRLRPPAPPTLQPEISDYNNNKPRAHSSPLLKSWKIMSGMITKPTQPPPPAPSASGMIRKPTQPPPPAPGASLRRTGMSNFKKRFPPPPSSPNPSPSGNHVESGTIISGHSSRSPPPRDIWIASTFIADC